MSLTQILSSTHFKELKEKLRQDFPRPKISLQGELIAPAKSVNYGIVGTAFDYLFRFKMEHLHKEKIFSRDGWVADSAIQSIKAQTHEEPKTENDIQFDKKTSKKEKGEISAILRAIEMARAKQFREFYDAAINQYKDAKSNYAAYIETGIVTNDLIKSSIVLAKLDLYARAGILDNTINKTDTADIEDLHRLMSIIPEERFTSQNTIYLNPIFGEGSALFGGADADLIIDDTLIDIKTTKHLEIDRAHINQLLCYYLASLIGGVNGKPPEHPIKNIGIYFSRYGVLWTIPLWKFGNDFQFHKFKGWLIKYMEAHWL